MAIETRRKVETVRVVHRVTGPKSALIVVLPVAKLAATPWALIVAVVGVEEVQTTEPVMSCVEESLNVPVAVNCSVVPTGMLGLAGVTAIEERVALVTVKDPVPLTDPEDAVIVTMPVPTPVESPVGLTVHF
jgi:hypothetical protein